MTRTIDDAGGEHLSGAVQITQSAMENERSSYGSVPGAEFPPVVYLSVLAAFVWVLVSSWLAFAGDDDADLALAIAIVLAIVFFALPVMIRQVAASRSHTPRERPVDFLSSRVETATGTLTGASAWLQVLLIPLALALAATLIGITSALVHAGYG